MLIDAPIAKKNWENFLKTHQGISVTFTSLEIIKRDGSYFLLGTSAKINAILELRVDNGNIYEGIATGQTRTVTCAGCTAGCSPLKDKYGSWYCTAGCDECKKTETVTEEGILINN